MAKLNLSLTEPLRPYFEKYGIKIVYKQNQIIDRHEDTSQGVHYIAEGQVLLYTNKSDGSNQIIAILDEGYIATKSGSLIGQPQLHLYFEALTRCTTYRMPLDDFLSLLGTDLQFSSLYMQQVALNNLYLVERVTTLGEKNALKRIILWLLFMAKYYGESKGNQSTLRVRLSQEHIAGFTSLTRESVNKSLRILSSQKQIKVKQGQIIIADLNKLRGRIEILE